MMDLGAGIAIAGVSTGFFGAVITALAKFGNGRKNNFVRKDVCKVTHQNLTKDIDEIKEKIDKIYEHIIEDGKK